MLKHLRHTADLLEPPIRLTIGAIAVVIAFYLALQPTLSAWFFFIIGFWLIWDYLRHSGIWLAFHAFQQHDMAAVRYYIGQVTWLTPLNREARAYYHWLKGVLEASDNRFEAAKVHLLLAATGYLRTTNDRSLVQCLLAEVALQSGDPVAARQHLTFARELEHHEQVDRMIDLLSKKLAAQV